MTWVTGKYDIWSKYSLIGDCMLWLLFDSWLLCFYHVILCVLLHFYHRVIFNMTAEDFSLCINFRKVLNVSFLLLMKYEYTFKTFPKFTEKNPRRPCWKCLGEKKCAKTQKSLKNLAPKKQVGRILKLFPK